MSFNSSEKEIALAHLRALVKHIEGDSTPLVTFESYNMVSSGTGRGDGSVQQQITIIWVPRES